MRGERRKVSPINLPAKATGPGEVFSLQNHTEQKGGYFQRNAIGMGVFVEPVMEGYGLIPPYLHDEPKNDWETISNAFVHKAGPTPVSYLQTAAELQPIRH